MARTKIDDLAHDAEDLGTDEQKQVKGGAVPVVNTGVVAGAAGASALAASTATLAGLLLKRKATDIVTNTVATPEDAMSESQNNALFESGTDGIESVLKKPE